MTGARNSIWDDPSHAFPTSHRFDPARCKYTHTHLAEKKRWKKGKTSTGSVGYIQTELHCFMASVRAVVWERERDSSIFEKFHFRYQFPSAPLPPPSPLSICTQTSCVFLFLHCFITPLLYSFSILSSFFFLRSSSSSLLNIFFIVGDSVWVL